MQYLLIARHGRVDDLSDAREVARRLAETLDELRVSDWPVAVSRVAHAGTEASRATAAVFAEALALPPCSGEAPLGPEQFPPFAPDRAVDAIEPARARVCALLEGHSAPLLVGHQPAIDWLLDGWVDRPVALAAAELACLARADGHGQWHLWWVITPSRAAAIDALRGKIASKMTVLSVLTGFTLAVTGAVLLDLPDETGPRLLAGAAAVCFALAGATYICTLLAYDELMMPHRFWRGTRPSAPARGPLGPGVVARPPSSAGLVMFQHMTELWRWAIGALIVSGAGVALLAASAVWSDGLWASIAVIGVGVALVIAIARWWHTHRPRLGTED